MGKVKIAQFLSRAGLHLGVTTVGRMLKQRRTHHAPRDVVPHMGFTVWKAPPASRAVRQFLGRLIAKGKVTPKYIVCDKGTQFWCDGFKDWCRRKGVRPRFGAVGQHGSIAVVERFIRTMKHRCTRVILVSLRRDAFRGELCCFFDWFNEHWAHSTLGGRTPNEAYQKRFPACRLPRYEPRPRWPRGSPCAAPHALVRGRPGARLELEVSYYCGRGHLPIISLRRAA